METSMAYLVALAATVGNMLQGWHGGAIAGALLYLKIEFNLEEKPEIEGLIVASAIFTAFISTLFAGALADWLGRRTVLLISAVLYTIGAVIMAWSPHVDLLILGRSVAGIAIGFASAISPLYISECSPSEIRGQLLTFPQLCGSIGIFLSYALTFGISLMARPAWRTMLGVTLVPSVVYVALCTWYVPKSPRWLVSKGRMADAKQVLQRLRKKDDVSVELALLVEGLGPNDVTLQEYILHPANAANSDGRDQDGCCVRIVGSADSEAAMWIAKPIASANDGSVLGSWSIAGSARSSSQVNQASHKILPPDPLVSFIGSFQSNATTALRADASFKDSEGFVQFDEENPPSCSPAINSYNVDNGGSEEDLSTPLLDERNESLFSGDVTPSYSMRSPREKPTPLSSFSNYLYGSVRSIGSRGGSFIQNNDTSNPNDIGGGWQLGWQWSQEEGKTVDFKTVFLHQQSVLGDGVSRAGSMFSMVSGIASGHNSIIISSSLVGTPAQSQASLFAKDSIGPAMVHPLNTAVRGPAWADIFEPGVCRALIIGCTLQFLQQFSDLNAVLYYTPQILQASGAQGLLPSLSKDSTSLLASTISGLFVFPFIIWAIKLMDTCGRRAILLRTLPILPICLILVILIQHLLPQGQLQAFLSFIVLTSFMCCFIMGFGPVPNILCAEIFPTRVRGLCNGMCAAIMWLSTVFITYGFPGTVEKIGLDGVFVVFCIVSMLSWIYIYLKVPETKGIPLEVITELFAVSAISAHPKQPTMSMHENEDKPKGMQ